MKKENEVTQVAFNAVTKTKSGMTYLVLYPDPNGFETKAGAEKWECRDIANRQLYFVNDLNHAKELLKTLN